MAFTFYPTHDYFAHVKFMWHKEELIPSEVVLISLKGKKNRRIRENHEEKTYSYYDIQKNITLHHQPFIEPVHGDIYVKDLGLFLSHDVFFCYELDGDIVHHTRLVTTDYGSYAFLDKNFGSTVDYVGNQM